MPIKALNISATRILERWIIVVTVLQVSAFAERKTRGSYNSTKYQRRDIIWEKNYAQKNGFVSCNFRTYGKDIWSGLYLRQNGVICEELLMKEGNENERFKEQTAEQLEARTNCIEAMTKASHVL